MASRLDLSVLQGNDVTINLAVLEDDNATPQDLSGLTPSLLIKPGQSAPDADATATLTVGSGLTITNPSGGLLTAFLARTVLAVACVAWWRMDLTDNTGDRTTAIYGVFTTRSV